MKRNLLPGLILAAVAALALDRACAQPLDLSAYTSGSTGFYTNNFDSMGYSTNQTIDGTQFGTPGSLAGEWFCFTNATANFFGILAAGVPSTTSPGLINNWTNPFTGQFFNYPSYFDYIGGTNFYPNTGSGVLTNANYGVVTDLVAQVNEPNRCLGIRQTGAFGDPGASIVLKLANTKLYDNFKLSLDLINLDPTSPRETTWRIQYGIADSLVGVPTAFQDMIGLNSVFADAPGSLHWKSFRNLTINNGEINNIDGQVWIRIVTLATSQNTGNRQTFAIDNFALSWQVGSAGCTPETNAATIIPPAGTVYPNATVQFQVNPGAGTQPLYYQWRYNGADVGQVFPSQVLYQSQRAAILTLANVMAANQGTYDCIVSNVCGGTVYSQISSPTVLTLGTIPTVSLGYLRTLSDPSQGYIPTNSPAQLYQVTGIITTVTNTTTGNTASYYIQDATGGLNLFVTGGSAFRPQIGDEVTAVGYLNVFDNNLELESDLTGQNTATSVQDLSNNIPGYPIAKLLDWPTEFASTVTNRTVEQGTTNGAGALTGLGSKKGSVCLLTNVYFGTNAGTFANGNYYLYVTNASGLGGYVFLWGAFNTNLAAQPVPAFAYSVQGVPFANIGGAGNFWSGVGVSDWSDVVTNPLLLSVTRSGNQSTINWTAVPQTYSYTVWGAGNVAGPYSALTNGLKFSSSAGSYVDVNNANNQFYRVTTP